MHVPVSVSIQCVIHAVTIGLRVEALKEIPRFIICALMRDGL